MRYKEEASEYFLKKFDDKYCSTSILSETTILLIQNISVHISFLRDYQTNLSQKKRRLRQSMQSILIYNTDICRNSETTIIIANTPIVIALQNIMTRQI